MALQFSTLVNFHYILVVMTVMSLPSSFMTRTGFAVLNAASMQTCPCCVISALFCSFLFKAMFGGGLHSTTGLYCPYGDTGCYKIEMLDTVMTGNTAIGGGGNTL